MDLAYRSLEHVAAERFDALAHERAEQIAELDALRRVYAKRVARAIAGGVATIAAALLFAYTYGVLAYGLLGPPSFGGSPRGELTRWLLAVWPAALVVYLVARPLALAHAKRMLERPLVRTGDATHDLARLEANHPKTLVATMASRFEKASVALPLMAVSFAMPLTLHFAFGLVFQMVSLEHSFEGRDFDGWIAASVAIVGHAHITLAVCAWRYAKALRAMDQDELAANRHGHWLRAWGWAALASVLPGVLLLAIPPLLVLATGIMFIPAAWLVMRSKVLAERMLMS